MNIVICQKENNQDKENVQGNPLVNTWRGNLHEIHT